MAFCVLALLLNLLVQPLADAVKLRLFPSRLVLDPTKPRNQSEEMKFTEETKSREYQQRVCAEQGAQAKSKEMLKRQMQVENLERKLRQNSSNPSAFTGASRRLGRKA
eukprot:CAMPEP_0196570388 /NCGR_PEP_ID=MMETSP1081-20130531/447_1 /TAXON_ID=36882 /ORGANISM="Pyramimonas amylifera, Strain CCMP720" /LENGTH=107 /DNA_ID=CAMNT_0041886791 /DNA_START=259 /DNA_END=582 /DNA_ORIENTATION=+